MLQSRALGFWETFKAIEFTYLRHPLLQATIEEKGNVYYYAFNGSFKDIPIQFKKGISEDILQQSFCEGINSSVEPKKYLWRIDVFYGDNTIIFTLVVHHAPCDGKSMMSMVDDIIHVI